MALDMEYQVEQLNHLENYTWKWDKGSFIASLLIKIWAESEVISSH